MRTIAASCVLILAGCQGTPLSVLNPSVYDGGDYSLTLPQGYTINKNPIANLPQLAFTAISADSTSKLLLEVDPYTPPAGATAPAALDPSITNLALVTFETSFINGAGGKAGGGGAVASSVAGKLAVVSNSLTYTVGGATNALDGCLFYKQPKFYTAVRIGTSSNQAELMAMVSTIAFK